VCIMRVLNLDKLSPEENQTLNEVATEIRHDFNRLVESVGLKHEDNIDWIVGSISSRNKYVSPLFLRCCYLGLIEKVIERDQNITKILISDRPLIKVIDEYCKENNKDISVICTEAISSRLKRAIKPIFSYVFACIVFSLRFFGRSRAYKKKISFSSPITLLDTFVIESKIGGEGSIYRAEYRDRYYPGLLEHLNEEERKQVFYYPTLSGVKNLIKVFRLIRNANTQFIIPDDFLKISDYLFIFLHPFRIRKIRIPNTSFSGFDVTSMLKNEQLSNCWDSSFFSGLLNYRFAFRTAQENVPIRLLIDWHENQAIDRGMVVGFHRFHPETDIIGFQGYVISKTLHLYIYPTRSEFRSQAIPDRIGVVGRGLLKDIHEFSDDFEAVVAPAFRFRKVWENRKSKPDMGVFTILAALPIGLEGSANILNLIVPVFDKCGESNFRFWIKPHPTYGPEQIRPLLNGVWPKNCHFKSGDFNECVEGSNLLIGNASSTCLEAMAKGVPVIVVGDRNGIIENPIPEAITSDMWRLCYSPEEVADAIQFYEKRSPEKIREHEEVGKRIREEYFEPVTREGVRRFLGLPEGKYETYIYQKKNY